MHINIKHAQDEKCFRCVSAEYIKVQLAIMIFLGNWKGFQVCSGILSQFSRLLCDQKTPNPQQKSFSHVDNLNFMSISLENF